MRTQQIVFILAIFLVGNINGQEDGNKKLSRNERKAQVAEQVKQLVESKDFTFIARSANPTGGQTMQLSSGYDLKIKNDTAIAFLPYFGRAYSGGYDLNDSGVKFTDQMADYKSEKIKKGYSIDFKAGSGRTTYTVNLSISNSGYATVNVISVNRQAISYNGILDGLGL